MNKKAQGISINTIIIAAIALAVLVVLFAIFTGRLSVFSGGIKDTDTCRQKCDSLGKKFISAPTSEPSASTPCGGIDGGLYISGKYKEGDYGCCCGT